MIENKFIEYIGLSEEIDSRKLSCSCQLSIEGTYEHEVDIDEIVRVYIDINDMDYEIVKSKEDLCVICAKLNLIIEYVDKTYSQNLNIASINKYFTTYLELSNEDLGFGNIEISHYIDNALIKLVEGNNLYYFVHIILSNNNY